MTEARRRQAIVKMATDAAFAERVRVDPQGVAVEFGLDAEDMRVLESLRDDTGGEGTKRLDPRLSKSSLFFGGAAAAHASGGQTGFFCNEHGFHKAGGFQCDGHAAGFVCDGHPAGFVCDGRAAGFLCDGRAEGFLCNGHAAGFVCNGHAEGFQCNGHAGFVCNEHAGIQCNGHAGFFCDEHAGFVCDEHVARVDHVAGLTRDLHPGGAPRSLLDPGAFEARSGSAPAGFDDAGGGDFDKAGYTQMHDAAGHVVGSNHLGLDGSQVGGVIKPDGSEQYVYGTVDGQLTDGTGQPIQPGDLVDADGPDLVIDADGDVQQITHGPDGSLNVSTFDSDGNLVSESTQDADGSQLGGRIQADGSEKFVFGDSQGHLTDGTGHRIGSALTTPDAGNSISFDADGGSKQVSTAADGSMQVTEVDATGNEHVSTFDPSGNLVRENFVDADGSQLAGTPQADGSERYVYGDAEGNLVDGGGNAITIEQTQDADGPDMVFQPDGSSDTIDHATGTVTHEPETGGEDHGGTGGDEGGDKGGTDSGNGDDGDKGGGKDGTDDGTDGTDGGDKPSGGSDEGMGDPEGDGTDGNSGARNLHGSSGGPPEADPETAGDGPKSGPAGGGAGSTDTHDEGRDANTGGAWAAGLPNVAVTEHVNDGTVRGTAVYGKVNPGALRDPLNG